MAGARQTPAPRRNVVVFVADGLRHGSVNERDTPALSSIRRDGVHFENSHSVFPTLTMANASAIATGHGLGDTGFFSNTVWTGFPTFDTGNFSLLPESPVVFLENDRVLSDLDSHFEGNVLGRGTLLELARAHGYRTAVIGKSGPAAVQDIAALAPENGAFPAALPGVVIDDATGQGAGVPLPPALVDRMWQSGQPVEAPTRSNGYGATSPYNNGNAGSRSHPGTLAANVVQQAWFADLATKVVLPGFASDPATPFVLVYWSRDPDGTQHNQGDSLGALSPGINGETSLRAVRNADRNLQQILAWLDAHPDVKANTDVFVTSDHGFATVSLRELDRTGTATASAAAHHVYADGGEPGALPAGFLAVDLASSMQMNLFDPDQRAAGTHLPRKLPIDPLQNVWEHPAKGNAFIGGEVVRPDGSDARVIVAANGGSDLIYVPDRNPQIVARVVELLLGYDYVDGVFVDDEYGSLPGTLPLSAINLVGASRLPRPAIVVAFKVFYLNPEDLQTAIQITDSTFQEGQGYHGGFGRDSTYNNMAAMGPDFKARFVDPAPAGNADIAPTLARVMGFDLPRQGRVPGRVLSEALAGAAAPPVPRIQVLQAMPAADRRTTIFFQEADGVRYLTVGCLLRAPASQPVACR